MFNYYGPDAGHNWPMVTTFGSIDLAGFAKASAYWYRTWWYYSAKSKTSYNGYNVPIIVNPYASPSKENPINGYIVHNNIIIVQKWEPLGYNCSTYRTKVGATTKHGKST